MEEGLRGRRASIHTSKNDDTPGSSFGNGQMWKEHGGENGRREGESVACGWLREGVRSHVGMRRSGKAWTPQGRQCWACALRQRYSCHSLNPPVQLTDWVCIFPACLPAAQWRHCKLLSGVERWCSQQSACKHKVLSLISQNPCKKKLGMVA